VWRFIGCGAMWGSDGCPVADGMGWDGMDAVPMHLHHGIHI
jgi:hypothetical protein